jgi:cytochrome d ubiquinol oxidase subunit I
MNELVASRIQFGFTIAFHYLFPPLSIGLALALVAMEGAYLATREPLYEQLVKFWIRIFGLTFAMGVATGIVMEFEFGTNWASFARFAGDIFGSALAAEGIFGFFIESGFLALLLFGWDRVSPSVHFLATVMVALGAHFSAIWIIVDADACRLQDCWHRRGLARGRYRLPCRDLQSVVRRKITSHPLRRLECWRISNPVG